MQGTWHDVLDKDAVVVVKADTMQLLVKTTVLHKLKFKLDATRSPRRIDLTIAEGMGKGQKMLWIYKFAGGKLVIAYPLPRFDGGKLVFGQPRPKTFPANKAAGLAFLTLEK